jgi:hypothetical protein
MRQLPRGHGRYDTRRSVPHGRLRASRKRPERDKHPLADTARGDLVTDRDHLGHRLVPDRERPWEEAHRRHRPVKITPRDRQRTYQRATGIRDLRFGSLLPCNTSSVEKGELARREEPNRSQRRQERQVRPVLRSDIRSCSPRSRPQPPPLPAHSKLHHFRRLGMATHRGRRVTNRVTNTLVRRSGQRISEHLRRPRLNRLLGNLTA